MAPMKVLIDRRKMHELRRNVKLERTRENCYIIPSYGEEGAYNSNAQVE